MIYPGLVSVTFRKLTPGEIVKLVVNSGLQGIEWGGDIHVPHGNIAKAKEVYSLTEANGLKTAAYGSYYTVGNEDEQAFTFEQVLETAIVLRAPTIRVWAGNKGSKTADSALWDRVIRESYRIAVLAASVGITISYEFHGNTLTDTSESAYRLLKGVNHSNIRSYWQPPANLDLDLQMDGLKLVLPWLSNIHVFYDSGNRQLPLSEGTDCWSKYLKVVSEQPEDRFAMLEFVMNESPDQFLQDAKVLRSLVENT